MANVDFSPEEWFGIGKVKLAEIVGGAKKRVLIVMPVGVPEPLLSLDEVLALVEKQGIPKSRYESVRWDLVLGPNDQQAVKFLHELESNYDLLSFVATYPVSVRWDPDPSDTILVVVDSFKFLRITRRGSYYFTTDTGDKRFAFIQDQAMRAWENAFVLPKYEALLTIQAPPAAEFLKLVSIDEFRDWNNRLSSLAKNPEDLKKIERREFERLVTELLSRDGYDARVNDKRSHDGGVDIFAWLDTKHFGRQLFIVQCKRPDPTNPVDIRIVRELKGCLADFDAVGGLIATTTRLTSSATNYVDKQNSRLARKEYDEMVSWIKKHASAPTVT